MTAKQEEPIKILLKYCNNFIKMSNDEKSEGIKINYWMGIESQIKMLKIDNETSIKIIFEEIFKKQTSILKTKHLLYCIINFLKPMNESIFVSNFFELLMIFSKEYEDNKSYFVNYLIDLSLSFFFEINKKEAKNNENDDCFSIQMAFFIFLIEKDIDLFSSHFDVYYFKETHLKNMFDYPAYIKLFIAYLVKISSINQFHHFQYLLSALRGIKINQCFNKELLKILVELISRNINNNNTQALMSSIQLIYFVIQLTSSFIKDIEGYDVFLLNALELIVSTKTFHFELIKILNDIYSNTSNEINSVLIMFKRLFPCVLYFFSDSCYAKEHIDFYIKAIDQMTPLYKRIIIKKTNVLQMIPIEMISQSPIIFTLNEDDNQSKSSSSFKFPIEDNIKSLKHVSNLNLIDFMIKSSINLTNSNESTPSLCFYETKFYQILYCFSLLSINTLSPNLYEMVSEFLMIFTSSIIDLSLIAKKPISHRIIKQILLIIKQTSQEYQTEIIYPIVIQIMRGALIPSYDLFIDNNSNETISLFFEYLCEFARNDNIALLTSRLLIVLYNSKILKGNDHRIYSLKTLVNLCVSANNSKIFQFYFSFAKEQINVPQTRFIGLHSLNDYAAKYEGALQSPLIEYALTMFQQIFDKSIDLMQFDSDSLFATSTIVKIFQKDKTENLIALLKQYFLQFKFIDVLNKITLLIKEGNVTENELGIQEEDSNPQFDLINSVKVLLNNISCLDYDKYILEKQSKCQSCLFAILKQLSILFSELLSHFVTEENELNFQSEQKQQTVIYQSLVKYFDFFWEKIVNSSGKETSNMIIINEILSNKINYHFFYVTHSNLIANKQIKDTQSDFSHLEELTIKAINEKQNVLLALVCKNKKRIFLFKDAFLMILLKEIQMIALNYKQTTNKVIIIKSIWTNLFEGNNNQNHFYPNDIGSSFFVLEFISLLMSKDSLVQNKVLYYFFLNNNVFSTYFKQLTHLIDLNYIMLEYYSIIRESYCPSTLIRNFFNFDLTFIRISKPIQLFTLRIMSNSDIYHDLIIKGEKCPDCIFDIFFLVFENLIKVNSYQMESKETLSTILKNMEKYIEDSLIYQTSYLISYANFLLKLMQILAFKEHKKSSNENEINSKLKSLLIESLLNKFLPSLIRLLYQRIEFEFSENRKRKESRNQYIDYLYNVLDIILRFKSLNLVSDLTNGILDINIIDFIDNFNQGSEAITNVFLNSLCNNYIVNLQINVSMAKFTLNYILYKNLVNINQNRLKTLRDQTLILFDENSKIEVQGYEHRQKIGYMLLLSSLVTQQQSIIFFKGQDEIFQKIGEIISNEINAFITSLE